jgi:hypothetical protein
MTRVPDPANRTRPGASGSGGLEIWSCKGCAASRRGRQRRTDGWWSRRMTRRALVGALGQIRHRGRPDVGQDVEWSGPGRPTRLRRRPSTRRSRRWRAVHRRSRPLTTSCPLPVTEAHLPDTATGPDTALMGRGERGTLLRLALALMTSDSHNMTRGEPNNDGYLYECPNGHTRRLPRHRENPPLCNVQGCGQRMEFVARRGKP